MSYLAFDTSNYTTSVACITDNGFISERKLLEVKQGDKGLRQSDALFQHVKQLPSLMKQLNCPGDISAVGVSTRPRSVEGSYMPVFLAGISFAQTAASVLGVPLYEFSHQDGHIMAGICSSNAEELLDEEFISVHLSGGTTEILKTAFNGKAFSCEIVGGTKDISAGQLIDRTGVMLGMKFPCGKELDNLSKKAVSGIKLPVSCSDGYFNLSGLENKVKASSAAPEEIAKGVFESIALVLRKSITFCCEKYKISNVLMVGGVASNTHIRCALAEEKNITVYFATPEMSTDNACGIAALTKYAHEHKKKG